MPFAHPMVEIRFLLKLDVLLQPKGLQLSDILDAAGLEPSVAMDPKTLLPLECATRILDETAALLDDPALGLHYGEMVPPGAAGLIGHLMLATRTVREMLQIGSEYSSLHLRNVDAGYAELDGIGRFSWVFPASVAGSSQHYAGFLMAGLASRIRLAAGPRWEPLAVHFQHREPANLEPYVQALGPRLKFEQSASVLLVDPTTLSRHLPPVYDGLLETIRELGDRIRAEAEPPDADVAAQVQREIARRLGAGQPFSLEAVATALGYAPRSLQYRLRQRRTSFESVLAATRCELAAHYLRDTDMAITTIAAKLGFSEPSAFTRAAQKWFAMAPRRYRHRSRAVFDDRRASAPDSSSLGAHVRGS